MIEQVEIWHLISMPLWSVIRWEQTHALVDFGPIVKLIHSLLDKPSRAMLPMSLAECKEIQKTEACWDTEFPGKPPASCDLNLPHNENWHHPGGKKNIGQRVQSHMICLNQEWIYSSTALSIVLLPHILTILGSILRFGCCLCGFSHVLWVSTGFPVIVHHGMSDCL